MTVSGSGAIGPGSTRTTREAGRVPRREFDADHSAEAVPEDNRLVNSHYRAELCKVVCKLADGVAILPLVAATATA